MLINAQMLVDRLGFVSQATGSKASFPECHKNALVEIKENGIFDEVVIRAFDGTSHLKTSLGNAESTTVKGTPKPQVVGGEVIGGPFVFDPKSVINTFKKSKAQVKILIDFDKKIIVFQAAGVRVKEVGMDGSTFATMPETDKIEKVAVPEILAQGIRRAAWAVDKQSSRPGLKGVMFRVAINETAKSVQVFGTDQTVMALVEDRENYECFESSTILEPDAAIMIADLLAKGGNPSAYADSKKFFVESGGYHIVSVALGEPVMNFWEMITKLKEGKSNSVAIESAKLTQAIDIASSFGDEYGSVLFVFRRGKITVFGVNPLNGRGAESTVEYASDSVIDGSVICLQAKKARDILKGLECSHVELCVPEVSKTLVIFRPVEQSNSPAEVLLATMTIHGHYMHLLNKIFPEQYPLDPAE